MAVSGHKADRVTDVKRLMSQAGLPTTGAAPLDAARLLPNEAWLTLVGFLERKTLSVMSGELDIAHGTLDTRLREADHARGMRRGYAELLLFFVKECLPPAYASALGKQIHKALGEYFKTLWASGRYPQIDLRLAVKDLVTEPPNKKEQRHLGVRYGVSDKTMFGYMAHIREGVGLKGTIEAYWWVMLRLAVDYEQDQGDDWPGDPIRIFSAAPEWPAPRPPVVAPPPPVSSGRIIKDVRRLRSAVLSPEQMAVAETAPLAEPPADLNELLWSLLVSLVESDSIESVADRLQGTKTGMEWRLREYSKAHQFAETVDLLDWFVKTYLGRVYAEKVGERVHGAFIEVLSDSVDPQALVNLARFWVDPTRSRRTLAACAEECGLTARFASDQLTVPLSKKLGRRVGAQRILRLFARFAAEHEKSRREDWPADRPRIFTIAPTGGTQSKA